MTSDSRTHKGTLLTLGTRAHTGSASAAGRGILGLQASAGADWPHRSSRTSVGAHYPTMEHALGGNVSSGQNRAKLEDDPGCIAQVVGIWLCAIPRKLNMYVDRWELRVTPGLASGLSDSPTAPAQGLGLGPFTCHGRRPT